MINLIYIQIIIFAFIIYCTWHNLLPIHTKSLLHTVFRDPFCWFTLFLLLLVFVSCYPFIDFHAVDFFFLPECFWLVQNNDCTQKNDASTCMAAPMTGLKDQLNWIHVSLRSPSLSSSPSLFYSGQSLLPSLHILQYLIPEVLRLLYNNFLKWNKVCGILNKIAVLCNLKPVKLYPCMHSQVTF